MKKKHFWKRFMGSAFLLGLVVAMCSMSLTSCGGGDDDDDDFTGSVNGGGSGSGSGSGSATVKITKISQGNKVHGQYAYKVTVKASGVSASEVKIIGISWGKTSNATGHMSTTGEKLSTTRTMDLHSNSTYYVKCLVKTAKGYSYSKAQRVKVPK